MASRELRDPIHGFIKRMDREQEIIDCPVFQRLRKIKQLALASLVYPGATHSRFEHSIGAMHVAGRMAEALGLDGEETSLVRLAALLQDIGHGPFSHVSEPVLERYSLRPRTSSEDARQIHELITTDIILKEENLGKLLSGRDKDKIIGIIDGTWGDSILHSIVSGPLDADKQDYLLRDSYYCGVRYGLYDLDRMSDTLCVISDPETKDRYLAITEDGSHTLEQFVLAKYYMTTQVYRHKIRLISDGMIGRALKLGIEEDGVRWLGSLFSYDGSLEHINTYTRWTDERLVNEVLSERTPNGYLKNLFIALTDRRLHKRIASYALGEFEDPLVRDALAGLTPEISTRLEHSIGELLSIDPKLVIVHSFDIKSVREQSRNSEASIVVDTSDGLKDFEQTSTLFRSIDEAIKEKYLEVYAPIVYRDEKQKRQLQKRYKQQIREILGSVGTETRDERRIEQ
jgi:HD superfamily phosphohydrolase